MTPRQLKRTIKHLTWMIQTMDFYNRQTGIDGQDSPELADAKDLLDELQKQSGTSHIDEIYCTCDLCRQLRGGQGA
jgi:hypothetical protein